MSFVYTGAKERIAKGNDLSTADVRFKLLMTNTTADTDQDATNMAGISTLDEYDGAGYAEVAAAAEAVVRDDPNNRAEITTTSPISFGATVAAGTRSAQGMLMYVRVDGTTANDWPLAWIDSGGFPLNGGGGPFTATMNAEGWVQLT